MEGRDGMKGWKERMDRWKDGMEEWKEGEHVGGNKK